MTDEQFALFEQVYRLVGRIADSFGSEDSSTGLTIPTTATSLQAACRTFLPGVYRVYPLAFADFVTQYADRVENEAVRELIDLISPLNPEAAYAASADFDIHAHNRGTFKICLFVPMRRRAGRNFLLCFNRVET